jgi:hypothetical protein
MFYAVCGKLCGDCGFLHGVSHKIKHFSPFDGGKVCGQSGKVGFITKKAPIIM